MLELGGRCRQVQGFNRRGRTRGSILFLYHSTFITYVSVSKQKQVRICVCILYIPVLSCGYGIYLIIACILPTFPYNTTTQYYYNRKQQAFRIHHICLLYCSLQGNSHSLRCMHITCKLTLLFQPCHSLGHTARMLATLRLLGIPLINSQVKKGELTGATAMLVHESTGQITAKYCAEIIVRNLGCSA